MKVPTEPLVWITGAKLEEAQGNVENVDKVRMCACVRVCVCVCVCM